MKRFAYIFLVLVKIIIKETSLIKYKFIKCMKIRMKACIWMTKQNFIITPPSYV